MNDPAPTQVFDWERRYRDGTTPWESAALNRPSSPGVRTARSPPAASCSPALAAAWSRRRWPPPDSTSPSSMSRRARSRCSGSGLAQPGGRSRPTCWNGRPTRRSMRSTTRPACAPCRRRPGLPTRRGWPAGCIPADGCSCCSCRRGSEGGPPFDCAIPAMRALFDRTHWTWPETLPAPQPSGLGYPEQPAVLLRGRLRA